MDNLYQLRKDIDELYSKFFDVDSGEWNISSKEELDEILERLNSDNSLEVLETNLSSFRENLDSYVDSLESFESQLEGYGESLEGFGGQLEDYGESLEGFSGQLSDYSDTLDGFSGDLSDYEDTLDGFSGDLSDYGTQLATLDDALNNQSTGFIATLSTLKTYIYGYDPQNPSAHTYNNPTSDSLKGMTNSLEQLIIDLQTGDGIVLENLGRLKSHIQAFSGTLQEFKTYLTSQGVNVSTLNDDVISLILELNKSLDTISDHQEMLEDAQEIIGEPSSGGEPATGIFKRLEDGEDIMDAVSTQADAIDVIVRGDPEVQSDTGLVGATSRLETKVGDNNSGLIKKTNDLDATVGDSNSGLVKLTNDLDATVGDSSSGLVKLTNDLDATVGDSSSGLVKLTNDLDNAVGDSTSGLIKQTNDLESTIGDPRVGQTAPTGLHLAIENAQNTANAVDGVATNIKNKIGYNSIPDESPLQSQITAQGNKIGTVPSGSTLQGQITAHDGDISDLNDIVGDVDVTTDGDLQTQINGIRSVIQNNNENQAIWVFSDITPPSQTWLTMMYDKGIDVDNIHYGYSVATHQGFVRNGSTWTQYDIDELNELVDFATGVALDVRDVSTVTSDEVWDTMLSLLYDVFYVKENGSWVITNTDYPYKRNAVYTLTDWLSGTYNNIPVGDYKCQHRINREINSVLGEKTNVAFRLKETITKNGATAKIYANNGFVYIKYSGTVSLTANTNLNMGTLADTSYAPIDYEYAPINHVGSDIGIYGAINQSGIVYVINDSSRTSVTLHGGIMYPLTSNIYDI